MKEISAVRSAVVAAGLSGDPAPVRNSASRRTPSPLEAGAKALLQDADRMGIVEGETNSS
jgi:hypothetical protein